MNTIEKYRRYVNTSSLAGIEPIVVGAASGATVTDVDGTVYTDLFSGISVVGAGHGHPRVIDAARRQMDDLVHCASYVYHVPVVADLAERLAMITPGRLQRTFFGNSGAEAVEGALRLARAHTGRRETIALQTSFHGRTAGSLAVTGNSQRKKRGGFPPSGVAFAPAPHPYRCRMCQGSCTLACADAVEDTLRYETAGDVAAFIIEPMLGEGGLVPLPDGYLERLKPLLDRENILLIIDEVQTGFGRTGKMFGVEHTGVEPDIMTMAKGIADGFPLGAFIARDDIAAAFRPGEHMSTFGGNPVSCAAALATIDVLVDEQLPARAAALGAATMRRLEMLAAECDVVGEVRGLGLMIGIELVIDRATKQPAADAAALVKRQCRENGVMVGVGGYFGNVMRIQPPLVIGDDQLGRALDVVESAIRSLSRSPVAA